MKYSPRKAPKVGVIAIMAAGFSLYSVTQAQVAGPNVTYDPNDSHGTAYVSNTGDFSTSDFWDGTTDAPFVSGTNAVGNFVPGDGAIFMGPAGTIAVSAPIVASHLEVGVTSGTLTFGTVGNSASIELPAGRSPSTGPNYNQPQVGPDFLTPITVDSGSENVVFNSNLNLGLINHFYGEGAFLNSSTSGNIAFNGGITFTNNTSGGDNVGQPALRLASSTGTSFTINSAVNYVEAPGSSHLGNPDNVPRVFLGSAGSTLTLTSGASFSDVRVQVDGGTLIDQGANYSSPVYGTNYQIAVGGTGQYLTGTAGMTVKPNILFSDVGGTIGSALAAETTYSSVEIVGYSGANMNLTSAAGGRVNFTGDLHNENTDSNGNYYSIVKIGAGTVNLDDTSPRGEDHKGGLEVKNGTLLLNANSGVANSGSSITGSGVEIDNVATAALMPNAQAYATLGGVGATAILVTADGANSTIAPGDLKTNNGIGTLTLSGGLMASNGMTFNFDLNGAKANGFDTIAFNGSNLTLGGTVTFNFSNLGGTLDSGPYTLLTGFSPLITGGSSDAALFVLNAPAGYVATIDPSDLLPGATSFAVDFTAAAVPEPSTYALFGLGLAGLLFVGRFRKLSF